MKILLAINAGSSSVKISVYAIPSNGEAPSQMADLQVSGLTSPPAKLQYTRHGTVVRNKDVVDADSQDAAFKLLLDTLISDDGLTEIGRSEDIAVAAHRIVHGGDYDDVKTITKETYHHLEELSDLAPLHNGPALSIVSSCVSRLPHAVNAACFDSQFHASIPAHIATYPIDQDVARKNKLRKYGFHGISYAFVTRSVAEFLGKSVGETNVIALHLGSGASACAVKAGKSWNTSMGLTPVSGLPGATRSGNVDPSLVFHFASDVGKLSPASTSQLHISKAEEILNKQSGWRSLTGTTDFSAISSTSADTPPSHRLAFDLFVDRIAGFVGSYYVSLGGQVDALVFAGGIGEGSARLRAEVVEKVECLGFALDQGRNQDLGSGKDGAVDDVGAEGARHSVLVCRTDEQYEMAKMCAEKADLWK